MNEKERMIELTKEAYKQYLIAYEAEPSYIDTIRYTFDKYYFYMEMLTTIYPELNRKELQSDWSLEIEKEKWKGERRWLI